MALCCECSRCIEYGAGDVRCSYGKRKGSLNPCELHEEYDCSLFVRRQNKNKSLPSEIKIAAMSHKCYKGDIVAMQYQTSLF